MNEKLPNIRSGELSRFRVVVVAAIRAKQLRNGSKPRIELDRKRKDTSIATEEVRRGLISFTQLATTTQEVKASDLSTVGVSVIA